MVVKINGATPPPPPPPPPSGLMGKMWNGASKLWQGSTWANAKAAPGAILGYTWSHGIQQPFLSPIGGVISSGTKETLSQALLGQPSKELLELQGLLVKLSTTPDLFTQEDIVQVDKQLQLLAKEDWKLLKQMAPKLPEEAGLLFKGIEGFFHHFATSTSASALNDFKASLQVQENTVYLQEFQALFEMILNENQGAFLQAMHYLNEALPELIDKLKPQIVGSDTSILSSVKKEIDKYLMDVDHGLVPKIKTEFLGENGLFIKALDIVQSRMTAMRDDWDNWMNKKANKLLSEAYKKLKELHSVIVAKDLREIKKLSPEAEEALTQLFKEDKKIFTSKPFSGPDRLEINKLIGQLPEYYGSTPPDPAQMLTAVQANLDILESYCNHYNGFLARTGATLEDTLTESVLKPITKTMQELPKKMFEGLASFFPTLDSPSQPGEGTLSQFLSYGASLLEKGVNSPYALSSFSSLLLVGLKQALKKMDPHSEALKGPRQALIDIIHHIENPQSITVEGLTAEQIAKIKREDPDAFDAAGNPLKPYEVLCNRLKRAADVMSPFRIYINGFLVPNLLAKTEGTDGNVAEAFLDNVNSLRETVTAKKPTPKENVNWEKKAKDEKDKLIRNTANYLMIKYIYEDVCGLQPDHDQIYLEWMKESNAKEANAKEDPTEAVTQEKLEKLVFKKLEEKKVGTLKILWAKFLYLFVYGNIIKKYVAKASTVYFDEIFNYIKDHKGEDFETLRNQLTKNCTRYLVILGGAYRRIAKSEETGLPEEMLKKELEKPESNLEFDTKQLYLQFAQNAIKKTMGSGFLIMGCKKGSRRSRNARPPTRRSRYRSIEG